MKQALEVIEDNGTFMLNSYYSKALHDVAWFLCFAFQIFPSILDSGTEIWKEIDEIRYVLLNPQRRLFYDNTQACLSHFESIKESFKLVLVDRGFALEVSYVTMLHEILIGMYNLEIPNIEDSLNSPEFLELPFVQGAGFTFPFPFLYSFLLKRS